MKMKKKISEKRFVLTERRIGLSSEFYLGVSFQGSSGFSVCVCLCFRGSYTIL